MRKKKEKKHKLSEKSGNRSNIAVKISSLKFRFFGKKYVDRKKK